MFRLHELRNGRYIVAPFFRSFCNAQLLSMWLSCTSELQCSYYTDRIVRVTITVKNCEKWQDAVLAIKSFPLINAPWTLYSLESSDWTHGHSRFHANMNKMGEWNDCTDHFRLRHCNWLNPVLQIVPKQTLFICRADSAEHTVNHTTGKTSSSMQPLNICLLELI